MIHTYLGVAVSFLLLSSIQLFGSVSATHQSGLYQETIQLELISTSTLRYSDDTTPVTLLSPQYSTPITITTSTAITVQEYMGAIPIGEAYTFYYLFIDPATTSFNSHLPIVVVDNFGAGPVPIKDNIWGGETPLGQQPAFMLIFESESGKTIFQTEPTIVTNIGIKVRGSSSSGFPKKSYSVESWDSQNNDVDIAPLNMPKEEDWILLGAQQFDQSYMRNPLIFEIWRSLGYYSPRWKFCEVFLNSDGGKLSDEDFLGIYLFTEKIKRDSERVALNKLSDTSNTEPNISGGYILKIDRLEAKPAEGYITDYGFPSAEKCYMNLNYPDWADITEPQKEYILGYVQEFENQLYADNSDSTTGYPHYMHLPSAIDFLLINDLSNNPDGIRLSSFINKPRNGKLHFGPLWDFDRTMGSKDDRSIPTSAPWVLREFDWFGELLNNTNFENDYHTRWHELRTHGPLQTAFIDSLIDAWSTQLDAVKQRDEAIWIFEFTIDHEVEYLKSWIKERSLWLDKTYSITQSAVPSPCLSAPTITFSSLQTVPDKITLKEIPTLIIRNSCILGGTLYYTLDGSEPTITATHSLDGEQSITLTPQQSVHLKARTLNDEVWSETKEIIITIDALYSSINESSSSNNNYNSSSETEGHSSDSSSPLDPISSSAVNTPESSGTSPLFSAIHTSPSHHISLIRKTTAVYTIESADFGSYSIYSLHGELLYQGYPMNGQAIIPAAIPVGLSVIKFY